MRFKAVDVLVRDDAEGTTHSMFLKLNLVNKYKIFMNTSSIAFQFIVIAYYDFTDDYRDDVAMEEITTKQKL